MMLLFRTGGLIIDATCASAVATVLSTIIVVPLCKALDHQTARDGELSMIRKPPRGTKVRLCVGVNVLPPVHLPRRDCL
ncbi:hypothetical protein EV126DRAFT_170299 [Verticillium dahliae]|nr:hypothetical protein EV126DRAFT_170299 [Verticillium dahliae]